ncbi:hypothetical protein DPMN_141060 [Dreissena polymorpha]|uniref:Uncharacterized protein n=1 Tax=Dreissena polymorpha TaxID=45954 RepID=A0A9D4GBL5_DREPO|nr:hypothetical protein DPMN_141060 [Dreissena polymorpha]
MMPPTNYDDILQRPANNWGAPLAPGIKVVVTLKHIAFAPSTVSCNMVPHNTISLVVRPWSTSMLMRCSTGSDYLNYKGYLRVIVLAVVSFD